MKPSKRTLPSKVDLYKAVFALWIKGYTPKEIGREKGMTDKRVYQIISPEITADYQLKHDKARAKRLYESFKIKPLADLN